MGVVINVDSVGKLYRLGEVGTGTLSHDLNRWWHRVRGNDDLYRMIGENNNRLKVSEGDYSWALRDVSFEVKQGEVLGIIGKNGAGKSTLLKILSRVTTPTTGEIKVKGRIASLLEVGTGFHPELTGRENIFLNGAILGMRKREIASKFDEIVEFSGCERYIDTPVKRYSSGMYVRLAFAVAAHLEPEILIVDEVLAVGDAEFQQKCLGKMKDVAGNGRTVLFVSHNMAAVRALCSRAVLLCYGALAMDERTAVVVEEYFQSMGPPAPDNSDGLAQAEFPIGTGTQMRLLGARAKDDRGQLLHTAVPYDSLMYVEIDYEVVQPNNEAYIVCCFSDSSGVDAWWQYDAETPDFGNRHPGKYRATIELPAGFLRAGRYGLRPAIVKLGGSAIDSHGTAFYLVVADTQSQLAQKGIQWPSLVKWNTCWTTARIDV
jgi:lipopolysaccharide transport system ATP-binding protein